MRRTRRKRHFNKHDFHPCTPRKLHRRDHICIAGHKDDAISNALMRHGRNVEADAHINTFLFEDGTEVGVGEGARTRGRLLGLPAAKGKCAAANSKALALGEFI